VRILITGANGYIGNALMGHLAGQGHKIVGTTRKELDLLDLGDLRRFEGIQRAYLCAARTRFIDCERDPEAYRINVDAQISLAEHFKNVVYLSSEAVESALHTAYGQHKALAEMGLRAVCKPVIARICAKVTEERLTGLCHWLGQLKDANPGVHRWTI